MMSVCLVQMPYAALERPSIALGLLKSNLIANDFEVAVHYANWWWAEKLGLAHYQALSESPAASLLGEWSFSQAAFNFDSGQDFLEKVLQKEVPAHQRDTLRYAALAARECAAEFLDEVAERLLQSSPKIVGCSSTFQQNCASLGVLKRIKALDPTVITVMGGANCDGMMGSQLVHSFDWLDFIFSGEADLGFSELCRHVAEDTPLPLGAVSANGGHALPRRSTLSDMDSAPKPDYSEYFQARKKSKLKRWVYPGLTIETSRGCWWGQKHHCTFCGLNGGGMAYRSKSAERVVEEFSELAEAYKVKQFEVVDNILDMKHIRTVLPHLNPNGYQIFYETKANLKRDQLETLRQAGVLWIQPGIESLHDEVLDLMDKGNTAAMNVELMRGCRELGIRVDWSILCGFPGEKDEYYHEMADWIWAVTHLEPPIGLFRIRYDRFSPYHTNPDKYGVKLKPYWTYQHCYPLEAPELNNLAYFFEDDGEGPPGRYKLEEEATSRPGLSRMRSVVEQWQPGPRMLLMEDEDGVLKVIDTRVNAPQERYYLKGLEREICLACETPIKAEKLRSRVGECKEAEWESALSELKRLGLILPLSGRLVHVALRRHPHPPLVHFPGGSVMVPN